MVNYETFFRVSWIFWKAVSLEKQVAKDWKKKVGRMKTRKRLKTHVRS